MEKHEYAVMAEFETFYWWYQGLHGTLGDILSAMGVSQNTRVLDAGCGTGGNLLAMNQRLAAHSFGFDFSLEASRFWKERKLKRCMVASINDMPYQSNVFDVAMSVDTLEIETVDPYYAVAELWRVTRPGGLILLVAPAYRWLLSEQHHRAIHASRRFTRSELVALLRQHPIEILRATYLFMALFPLTAAVRLVLRTFSQHQPDDVPPRSELRRLPTVVNSLFARMMQVERQALRRTELPFGSSILVLGRKL
jgi:SAM-dependent methyltransferase